MDANREIKVYGTLVNGTVGTISDATHNDVLVNAYQVYDSRFINNGGINNYQDIINKRVTGITYNNGVTTITGDLQSTGNIQAPNLVKRLADLQDIDLAGVTSGKYLKYDGVKWVPSTIAVSDITGGISLDNISNVNTTGATNGSVLKYNGSQWVAGTDESGAGSIGQLSDVSTVGAVNGSILKYNGSKWVVGTDNTGTGGATVLNELGDVTVSSPSNNQVLSYNGSRWVNKTVGVNDIVMPSAQEGQVLKYRSGSWVAANDETGSGGGGGEVAPAGYEFVTQTVTRVYNKIGEVSGLTNFTAMNYSSGSTTVNTSWYDYADNGRMTDYLNLIRNKSYIYSYNTSEENIPIDAVEISTTWSNIPNNLYAYGYKYNNILKRITNASSAVGIPNFTGDSRVREGVPVYYRSVLDAMQQYNWPNILFNPFKSNDNTTGKFYYGAFNNNSYVCLPGLILIDGSDNSFYGHSFSKITTSEGGWECVESGSKYSSAVDGKINIVYAYSDPYYSEHTASLEEINSKFLVPGLQEIAPNTIVQQIYAADDISMPQTITQVVVYKYLRPIQ